MARRAGTAGNTTRLLCTRRLFTPCTSRTRQGNKIEPEELGIEPESIDGAYDMVIFEDIGNGQTKLTLIGNEPMANAKESGQFEGWVETRDKDCGRCCRADAGEIRG